MMRKNDLESADSEVNVFNLDIKVIIIIILSCVIILLLSLNYEKSMKIQSGTFTKSELYLMKSDYYMSLSELDVGPIKVNNNMTLAQIQGIYWGYRNHPIASNLIISMLQQVCS